MREKLKPCPFCGETDKLECHGHIWDDGDGNEELFDVVYCNNHTVSAHIKVWQNRPVEDKFRSSLERIVKAINNLDRQGDAMEKWMEYYNSWKEAKDLLENNKSEEK